MSNEDDENDESKWNAIGIWSIRFALVCGMIAAALMGKEQTAESLGGLAALSFVFL